MLYTKIDQALKLTRAQNQSPNESDRAFVVRREDYDKVCIIDTIANSTVEDAPSVMENILDEIIKKYQ